MAKKKTTKAVHMLTVVRRINRRLAAKGQILIKTTRWMKLKQLDFGDYYILDLSGNVVDTHIDPRELARKLRTPHTRNLIAILVLVLAAAALAGCATQSPRTRASAECWMSIEKSHPEIILRQALRHRQQMH